VASEKLARNEQEILDRCVESLKAKKSLQAAKALFEALKAFRARDRQYIDGINKHFLQSFLRAAYQNRSLSVAVRNTLYGEYCRSLLLSARDDFESFMLYTESGRPFEEQFWTHRQKALRDIVNGFQEMANGELDLLFVELPPRVGKTTIALWFTTWMGARHPEVSNLLVGHSSALVKSFYEESETFIKDKKYKFFDVFPELNGTMRTQAKDLNINLGREKRYKTLQFKSIDSAMSGVVEASGVLVVDDIITGIEEALSPDRLDSKWMKLNTDVMQRRANSKVPMAMIGTPWAKGDPAERLYSLYKDDEKYRIRRIAVPATDEEGHSNFNYNEELGIGFTDEFYRKQQETMDEISYKALYLLQRLDREGLLFDIDKFERFDKGKLNEEPKAIHTFCDVAWGGGDYLAMPFIYEYDDGLYLADAVFSNKDKTITKPIVAGRIQMHKCYEAEFEANNGGDEYADDIGKTLAKDGFACRVYSTKSENGANAKVQRIIKFSPEIQKLKILHSEQRSQEYREFLNNVVTFNQNGKNKHDDAPDSLSCVFRRIMRPKKARVTIARRRF